MANSTATTLSGANFTAIAGDIRVAGSSAKIQAILGSCVAVCLFDSYAKIGGMNHFVLPRPIHTGVNSTRYGDCAMHELIRQVIQSGGDKVRLKAKAFGGASVAPPNSLLNAGEKNVRFVHQYLKQMNIPLVGFLLGGDQSMKVIFSPDSGRVHVCHLSTQSRLNMPPDQSAKHK